jgi:serine/threonine protein phosphatase PrpC
MYYTATMIRNPDSSLTWQPPLLGAIYGEIDRHNWSQPSQATIEELGVVIGTHPGLKRERNEDRVAVARVWAPNGQLYTVAILCDGVGGSESGDRAAGRAIASVVYQLAVQHSRPGLKELATTLVKRADDHVRNALEGRGATTLVLLLATSTGLLVCASVGDSRAYRWCPNGADFSQVTVDDTIENELKNLPGDHAALLQERGLRGRLSQAVGETGRTADDLRVQIHTRESFADGVVLGSDGLWRIAQDFPLVTSNAPSAADLVRRVLNLANWVGGVDNASVIAIEDLNRFCMPRTHEGSPPLGRGPSIALWAPLLKVKIVSSDWPRETPLPPKPVRTKRKTTTKSKGAAVAEDEQQLQLEPATAEGAKPKLEVTIGEAPKK